MENRNQHKNRWQGKGRDPIGLTQKIPTDFNPVEKVQKSEPVIGLSNESFIKENNPVKTSTVLVDNCVRVNIRKSPNKAAEVLTLAPRGTRLTLLSMNDGWAKVEVSVVIPREDLKDVLIGYVMEAYVTSEA